MPEIASLTRLYSRPGFLLRRAHQISTAVFESECNALKLTPAQYGVLTVLSAYPGLDQSSLARALGFDKVTMLRVLRVLEPRGLIKREESPNSKRNLSISLTPEGRKLLKTAQAPAERAYHRLLSPLDATQQAQLLSLLEQLSTGLDSMARAPFVPPT
ncbi:MAG: MarR family transcriptional regulator [Betaproteobacteria bacterium]|nr:MarR family transcriptional regulator [Betaproteobacteria bacterium]MBK7654256.1 MarR family transcriptional regulator [Betaproteobacteria bacterium]MBP6645931.1 MarR family transcriptional regulator [Burkholderiaceae bacterium]